MTQPHDNQLPEGDSPEMQTVPTIEPLPNFTLKFPITTGQSIADKNLLNLTFPSASRAQTLKTLSDLPQLSLGKDKASQKWLDVLNSGRESLPYNDALASTVEDEAAHFVQQVDSPTGPLCAKVPKFKTNSNSTTIGDVARLRIRSALNLGSMITVPLWHSGFWITLKAPSEAALLEVHRRITQDKISLGRDTYGMIFSNTTSYTNRILVDFALENIYETSFALPDGKNLKDYIKVPDLQILIYAIACVIWPNGFNYERACIVDVEKCNHVISEKLSLQILQVTNQSTLTDRQVIHMGKLQRSSVNEDAVKLYVAEFIKGQDSKIMLTDKLSMIIKMPSISEHIDAGFAWVNDLEENYGEAMGLNAKDRDAYLTSQGKASSMRQYAHFVKSVEVDEMVYDDPELMRSVLNDLTEDDQIRDKFLKEVAAYIDNSVISLVAIPNYKCPNCGNFQNAHKEHKGFPTLIPLDVSQSFFQLLVQKISKINLRE